MNKNTRANNYKTKSDHRSFSKAAVGNSRPHVRALLVLNELARQRIAINSKMRK